MSFATHYRRVDRVKGAAKAAVDSRVPAPTAAEMLSPTRRKRWFERALREATKVLAASIRQAERAGKAHGDEVVKEWED